MTMGTARCGLPFILPGQAQKELYHNEALQLIETIVQPVVEGGPINLPPASPAIGQIYIVGPEPSAGWGSPAAGALAVWTEGGWRFLPAFEGLAAVQRGSGLSWRHRRGEWELGAIDANSFRVAGEQVIGERQAAIDQPVGGSVQDVQARQAITTVLEALRQHGLIASE
jgi:hypothetical protein